MNRRLLGLAIALLVLAPASPAGAATHTVDEVGRTFQPSSLPVALNDTVVWTNKSNENHAIAFDDGTELSPNCTLGTLGCQVPGSTVRRQFTGPAGVYRYHCRLHPTMTGSVSVSAGETSNPGSSSSSSSTTRGTSGSGSSTSTTRATSSTTSTTRVLATSSTVVKSTTTTGDTSSAVLPGTPPPLSGEDGGSNAAGKSGGSGGSDRGTVALIVGLLLVVSAGGGYLLWRLRPGRA